MNKKIEMILGAVIGGLGMFAVVISTDYLLQAITWLDYFQCGIGLIAGVGIVFGGFSVYKDATSDEK